MGIKRVLSGSNFGVIFKKPYKNRRIMGSIFGKYVLSQAGLAIKGKEEIETISSCGMSMHDLTSYFRHSQLSWKMALPHSGKVTCEASGNVEKFCFMPVPL